MTWCLTVSGYIGSAAGATEHEENKKVCVGGAGRRGGNKISYIFVDE